MVFTLEKKIDIVSLASIIEIKQLSMFEETSFFVRH
jgi:hypothetical protein